MNYLNFTHIKFPCIVTIHSTVWPVYWRQRNNYIISSHLPFCRHSYPNWSYATVPLQQLGSLSGILVTSLRLNIQLSGDTINTNHCHTMKVNCQIWKQIYVNTHNYNSQSTVNTITTIVILLTKVHAKSSIYSFVCSAPSEN